MSKIILGRCTDDNSTKHLPHPLKVGKVYPIVSETYDPESNFLQIKYPKPVYDVGTTTPQFSSKRFEIVSK